MRSSHISHPHTSKLIGMVRKMRYLLQFLTLAFVHNLERYPIDATSAARHASVL